VNANLAAFLSMISHSEGTDKAPDPYRVCFGYKHTIIDLSNHPALTGEWHGERLPDAECISAGITPPCHSDAAGRYQITRPTWTRLLAKIYLPDFTGPNQDAACTELMREKGAVEMVEGGRVSDAIAACAPIWASLPGSTSGQPQRTASNLISFYISNGGSFV